MVRGRTETGEMEVRVVLQVRIDRDRWAADMLGEDPGEVLDRKIRESVKRAIRNTVQRLSLEAADVNQEVDVPITNVIAEGVYE